MSDSAISEVSNVHQTQTYEYTWTINNFCADNKNIGSKITSPTFPALYNGSKFNWELRLYPRGNVELNKDWISVYVYIISSINDVTAVVSFSILDNSNRVIKNKVTNKRQYNTNTSLESEWGFPQFVERDFLANKANRVLDGNKLTIECKIKLYANEEVAEKAETKINDDALRLGQFDEFEQLIDEKEYSDVELTVEGKTLRAHKCILAKRSPVFAVMFQTEMLEKQQNKVEIADMRHSIFFEMLRFIYAGKVNDIDAIAEELLAAADKYSLDRLKDMCEASMCENLSVDNAVERLELADRYRLDNLRIKAIDFVVSHASDFIDKPEFKLLTKMPEVLLEVCQAMAKKIM